MIGTKRSYRGLRVVDSNGRKRKPKNADSLTRCAAHRRSMHRKQLFGAELFAFPPGSGDHSRPVVQGDALPLAPLLDSPMTPANGFCHISEGVPDFEDVGDRIHARHNASDELSESRRTTYPVTKSSRKRTICPMGRGTTNADFVDDFCRRVRAAREMAGYADRDAFAKLMGIEKDTYFRYESRTPLPHRYIPRFLELTGADAQILFTGKRETGHRKTG